ncbi:MAG: hypothetical protein Q9162_002684 [Coniocarpon cinnabarinum]
MSDKRHDNTAFNFGQERKARLTSMITGLLSLALQAKSCLYQIQSSNDARFPPEQIRLLIALARTRPLLEAYEEQVILQYGPIKNDVEEVLASLETCLSELSNGLSMMRDEAQKLKDYEKSLQHDKVILHRIDYWKARQTTSKLRAVATKNRLEIVTVALNTARTKLERSVQNTRTLFHNISSEIRNAEFQDRNSVLPREGTFETNLSAHKSLLGSAIVGSESCFVSSIRFETWTRDVPFPQLLWCFGKPGCGKSVLSAQIVAHLMRLVEDDDEQAVAFYYFSPNEPSTVEDVAKVLLYQLHLQATDALDAYDALQPSTEIGSGLHTSELLSALEKAIIQFRRVYIVLDGFDEISDHQSNRMSRLTDVLVASHASFLITSRQRGNVSPEFSSLWTIEIKATEADLALFMTNYFQVISDEGESISESTKHEMIEQACGNFLRFKLSMDNLNTSGISKNMQTLMNALSSDPMAVNVESVELASGGSYEESQAARTYKNCKGYLEQITKLLSDERILTILVAYMCTDVNEETAGTVLPCRKGFSLIHLMAWFGLDDLTPVKRHSHAVPSPALIIDGHGRSPLHIAAGRGHHTFICCFMMSFGPEYLNLTDNVGRTALHYAVLGRHADAVQVLLNFKCELKTKDYREKTAWHYAVEYGNCNTIRPMINSIEPSSDDRNSALNLGIRNGQAKFAEFLIARGATLDAECLIRAIPSKSEPMLQLLTKNSADVNARSAFQGTTPLHVAFRQSGHIAKILLDGCADIRVRDDLGRTPLFDAVETADLPLIELCLRHGFRTDDVDKLGMTPLHFAVQLSKPVVVHFLLFRRADVDINVCDNKGRSPLFLAVETGDNDCASLLLHHRANANRGDLAGQSPLVMALKNADFPVIETLLSCGATVKQMDYPKDLQDTLQKFFRQSEAEYRTRVRAYRGTHNASTDAGDIPSSGASEITKLRAQALDPSSYKIAWICAHPFEMDAARACLDEVYESPPAATAADTNIYIHGRIGNHLIIIARPSPNAFGIASMVTRIRLLLYSFSRVRLGFQIGIGSGVPTAKNLELGDVIVALSPERPPFESQSLVELRIGSSIRPTRRSRDLHPRIPSLIRDAIPVLQSELEKARLPGIAEHVEDVLNSNPHIREEYKRPERSMHEVDFTKASAQLGRDPPLVHHGKIASTDIYVKDAQTRDRIWDKYEVLCLEREAFGVPDILPRVVIRGICDFADSRHDQQWQRYAALTAAVYTKELLKKISPTELEDEVRNVVV